MNDVSYRSSGRTRHDRDALRQLRQRLLPRGVEETFCSEPLLELLERELERPETGRFGGVDDHLKVAALLVDGEAPADDDF